MDCVCKKKTTISCKCKGYEQYFCLDCLNNHLKTHIFTSEKCEALSSSLKQKFDEIKGLKQKILRDTTKLVSTIHRASLKVLKPLRLCEKNIKQIISQVKINPYNLPDSPVKEIFKLETEKINEEIGSLKIAKLKISTPLVSKCIESWMSINVNLSYLSTNLEQYDELKKPAKDEINLIERPELNQIPMCPKNHVMKWNQHGLISNYLKSNGRLYVFCEFCNKQYSRISWNCMECNYHICSGCAIFIGYKIPNDFCQGKHELLWKFNVSYLYRLEGSNKFWICDLCNSAETSPHWNCINCKYDLCVDCGMKNGLNPLTGIPLCLFGDKLISKGIEQKSSIKCQQCFEKIKRIKYECQNCHYYICRKCAYLPLDSSAVHPVLSCSNFHILCYSLKARFTCNICYCSFQTKRFFCSICDFNICITCSNLLENFCINSIDIKDALGHEMKLVKINANDISLRYQCTNCSFKFTKDGIIYKCSICNDSRCIKCVSYLVGEVE